MTQQSTRALALARRKALSSSGKKADRSSDSNRTRGQTIKASGKPRKAAALDAPVRARSSRSGAASRASAKVSSRVSSRRSAAGSAVAVNPSRAAALQRRKAMSASGKSADQSQDRTREGGRQRASRAGSGSGDCGCGCKGAGDCADRDTSNNASAATGRSEAGRSAGRSVSRSSGKSGGSRGNSKARIRAHKRRKASVANPARAASMARRQAQSTRGKAASGGNGVSPAQTARASNPGLSSRELAMALREQRSRRGGAGQKKSAPVGRVRPNRAIQKAAEDAPWKSGVTETSHGQSVTGTMTGRSRAVTGDEASTCRAVTGTEYMGADVFREFCQGEPVKAFRDSGLSNTARGNSVTGNEVGRSEKVTGDEPGSCKNVTGSEYVSPAEAQAFCGSGKGGAAMTATAIPAQATIANTQGGRSVTGDNVGRSGKVTGDETGAGRTLTGSQYMQSEASTGKVPAKVGSSATLRGGAVTGTMTGRHENMTGDEAGSCRNVTGDDYVGKEQYSGFCASTPEPVDQKSGVSQTMNGERVTGTMTSRAERVTGNEPGTCKSVTGTPYAGAEQYAGFCEPEKAEAASRRLQGAKRQFGSVMTGIQPGVGGNMTGAEKGACESVSGTPYVGSDQAAEACPATAADIGAPDYPRPLPTADAAAEPWTGFGMTGPAHASKPPQNSSAVTGAVAEGGMITGPFGMADGKVTGTDAMRFGNNAEPGAAALDAAPAATEAETIDGRVKTRVTGEGINAGLKITGDDWDRGDHVTGTEGTSAVVRNPGRRGPAKPMASALAHGRPEQIPQPVSKVTGSSGNTENGSLITFSGGARG